MAAIPIIAATSKLLAQEKTGMNGFPIPSITGGAAGPSGVVAAPTGGPFTINKGANTFWLFMGAAVLTIGYVFIKVRK